MRTLLLFAFIGISTFIHAQWQQQYFDGNDTIPAQSIEIHIDSVSRSLWQIGVPQKHYFDDASSDPNVIVTDTTHHIPDSTIASFQFGIDLSNFWGVLAIQWQQKLDLEVGPEIGIIEYSLDTGQTWNNIFWDPYVYNFYGHQGINEGFYNPTGEAGFWGQDTVWRNIWLCLSYDITNNFDTIDVRFTCKTDSVTQDTTEGWMIDNLIVTETWFHTIAENSDQDAFTSFPTLVSDIIKVKCDAPTDPPKITTVQIYDMNGRLIDEFLPDGVNFQYDVSSFENGNYRFRVITERGFDTLPFIVQH